MMTLGRVFGLAAALVFVSACGGGGGDSGDSGGGTQPTSFTVSTTTTGTGSGTLSPTSRSVTQGSTTSFTISPGSGSTIAGVSGCSGTLSGTTYTTGAISSSCTVTATFELNVYTVTATAGSGGAIDPSSRAVAHGETTTFSITPDSDQEVESITGCTGVFTGNTFTSGPITAACSVSVSFRAITSPPPTIFTVTTAITGDGSGTVTPDSARVEEGQTAFFTITPGIGSEIESVSGCGGFLASNTYTTAPINSACTVEVQFYELPPIVRCISNAEELTLALSNIQIAPRSEWLQLVTGRFEGTFFTQVPGGITLTVEGGYSTGCVTKEPSVSTELDAVQQGIVLVVLLGAESEFYLSDVSISNGLDESPPTEGSAAGLYIGNPATDGAFTAAAYIENTSFIGNVLRNGQYAAGGLYTEVGFLRVSDSRFQSNSGHSGAGAFVWCGKCEITSSAFIENTASELGGGLAIRTDTDRIDGVVSEKYITVSDVDFLGNSAGSFAGGLYAQTESRLHLINSTFFGNSAVGNRGGGAEIALAPDWSSFNTPVEGASLEMSGNFFIGNTAAQAGGGLSVNSVGPFLIANNIFESNSTTELPPDPFANSEHGGGGIYAFLQERAIDTPGMRIVNNTFIGNETDSRGGAVHSRNGSNSSPTTYINNVAFENLAPEGTAFYIDTDFPRDFLSAPLNILHNAFDGFATVDVPYGTAEEVNNIEITQEAFENFLGGAFQPALGSPLIDAGFEAVDVPRDDILGNPRVGAPDIGAYER